MSDKLILFASLSLVVGCSSGGSTELRSGPHNNLTTLVEGNPTCEDLGFGDTEFKEEDPAGGETTHDLAGGGSITIFHDLDTDTFDWTSDVGIDAIIVKGGPDAYVYDYNPESFGDTGLVSPLNPGGNVPAISHISVCYDEDPDPCEGVQCDGATECSEAGVCNPQSGQCEYEPKDCSDPCEGVQCDGATECSEAGVCNPQSGQCEYEPKDQGTECSSDDNPCTVDICSGQGECVHEVGNEGTQCRGADGDCGSAEYCDGESSDCPEDTHASQGMCRQSAGDCDPAEYCTGDSSDCPADELSDASTICNESAGVCDPAEYCTGDSAECPADELDPYGTVCGGVDSCGHHNICTGDGADCADHSSTH